MTTPLTPEQLKAQADAAELEFNRQGGSTTPRRGEIVMQRTFDGDPDDITRARTSLTNTERLQQQRENDENERTR